MDSTKIITDTESYVRNHVHRVQERMYKLVSILIERSEKHDSSKLEEPEKSGFEAMDKEPRYPYGSKEYYDKMQRFSDVLDHHYRNNPHHPEYWANFIAEMDLLYIIEMLIDWTSYKEIITKDDANHLIDEQCKKYGIDGMLVEILRNTILRYLVIKDDTPKIEDSEEQQSNCKWTDCNQLDNIPIEEYRKFYREQFHKKESIEEGEQSNENQSDDLLLPEPVKVSKKDLKDFYDSVDIYI